MTTVPTDQGSPASLVESACRPELRKGMEGCQEEADQDRHSTGKAHTLVTTCTLLPACHPWRRQACSGSSLGRLGTERKGQMHKGHCAWAPCSC